MKKINWYGFTPVDTLFFRGAEPMNMGENHAVSHVFPPPAHTLSGALRTTVLIQNNIPFKSYGHGDAPGQIIEAIGKAGEPAPFSLAGPLFMKGDDVYVPAPYSWFAEKAKAGNDKGDDVPVIKGRVLKSRLIKTKTDCLVWARGSRDETVSLGGTWIKAGGILSDRPAVEVKKSNDFFETESRTGIALETNRRARKGHLYTFNHARLKKDVSLVFGVDRNLPLAERGVLKVGAEQRFGWYEKLAGELLEPTQDGDAFMSLSIVEGTEEANDSVIATGKILYFGGWDLNIGFHKSMKGFFPAGTVFDKKHDNCIAIKGVEKC